MSDNRTADRHDDVLPLARNAELVIQELPDETLVYDQQRHHAHCLNRTAAYVWKRCDGKSTCADVERLLREEMSIPAGEEALFLALKQLEDANLLAEPVADVAGERPAASRRELLKTIGLAAAAAVCIPLVTSIVAPTPAQAGSTTRPGGRSKTDSGSDCASGAQYAGYCL